MLTKKHKWVLELETKHFVETLMIGNYKTHFKNKWIEFADFREYQAWDDAKSIDFITSSKVWKTLVKLYEEERELNVHFLPFFWEEINFELNNINKRDIFEEILFILWISTVKQQNKFWSMYYNSWNRKLFPLWKGISHFYDYFSKIEKNNFWNNNSFIKNILTKRTEETSSGKLKYFNNLKIKNSLVFLFTSDLEIDEKQLKIAALKNDLVICNIFHSFENNLDEKWIVWFTDWQKDLFIDLDNKDKKEQYKQLRKNKVINFRKTVRKTGASYLYFDEKTNIFWEFYKFFKNR
jgi:hypothetical protein